MWKTPMQTITFINLMNLYLNDDVHGYTIRQIEDALIGQREWNGWRDNIKNRYNNETEENLDELFAYWDN